MPTSYLILWSSYLEISLFSDQEISGKLSFAEEGILEAKGKTATLRGYFMEKAKQNKTKLFSFSTSPAKWKKVLCL